METFGHLVDCRVRRYLKLGSGFSVRDLFCVVEGAIVYTVGEVYLALVLPALGWAGPNEPFPPAALLGRGHLFVLGPIGYAAMYILICGGIHYAYTNVWPEEGKRLSIQSKPMTDAEFGHAILFSVKSIMCTCFLSNYFHYALQGKTNVYWGLPQMSDLLWVVLAYFLIDLNAYWVHRMLHWPWWYARVHKVHHLWKSPNVFVVSALHPVEILLLSGPTLALLISLPISFPVVCLMLFYIYLFNSIDHSGMHLQGLAVCKMTFWQAHPEFHDHHHQYFHTNYGAMVDWWDKLWGTYYHPAKHGEIGLGEDEFKSAAVLRTESVSSSKKDEICLTNEPRTTKAPENETCRARPSRCTTPRGSLIASGGKTERT